MRTNECHNGKLSQPLRLSPRTLQLSYANTLGTKKGLTENNTHHDLPKLHVVRKIHSQRKIADAVANQRPSLGNGLQNLRVYIVS